MRRHHRGRGEPTPGDARPPRPRPHPAHVAPTRSLRRQLRRLRPAQRPTVAVTIPEDADPAAFSFASTTWQLPHAVLFRATSTAQLMRRTPEAIEADPAPPVMIQLLEAGRVDVATGHRSLVAGPGDVAVYDFARPFESRVEPFTVLSAMIARGRVPPALRAPGAHGLLFPADSPSAELIAAALRTLVAVLDRVQVAEAEVGLATLCTLVGGLIEAQVAATAGGGVARGTPLRVQAEAYIAERAGDPALTPRDLAAYLGVSRSGLYRLFEAQGGVEAVFTARRLDALVHRLLVGFAPLPSPQQLAAESGFPSEARLRRAFEARFGTTPHRFQGLVEGNDRAWLGEQARRAGFGSLEAWIAALEREEETRPQDRS